MSKKVTYSQFKQQKVKWSTLGGAIEDIEKEKVKRKPVIIDNSWIEPYWLERDRIIFKTTNDEETKQAILNRYGKA